MLEIAKFQKRVPADLDDALRMYEQSPETANSVRASILRSFELIEQFPEMYAIAYDDVRIAKTKQYPFLIEYRIANSIPIILSISHSNRREPLCAKFGWITNSVL